MTINFEDAFWTAQFNVFVLSCDCAGELGLRYIWQQWARFSLAQCPRCGAKAWLHANEQVWDTAIPVANYLIR